MIRLASAILPHITSRINVDALNHRGPNDMTNARQTILDRVNSDFRFRPCPLGADPIKHHDREAVRSVLGVAALDLVRVCPQSRELNHALNKIEEALAWAHAAIDRHGKMETAA